MWIEKINERWVLGEFKDKKEVTTTLGYGLKGVRLYSDGHLVGTLYSGEFNTWAWGKHYKISYEKGKMFGGLYARIDIFQ